MVDRAALLGLALALPAGSAILVPREWLMELLEASSQPELETSRLQVDLTPDEAGTALRRLPVTIRAYCNAGLFLGAYRMRGRQWRIPRTALDAFQAAERKAHDARQEDPNCMSPPDAA